jgi:hypothetical protein
VRKVKRERERKVKRKYRQRERGKESCVLIFLVVDLYLIGTHFNSTLLIILTNRENNG